MTGRAGLSGTLVWYGRLEETRQVLAAKFPVIFPHLDERQRRLLMGAEARSLGHGGIRLVARAAGVREATVSLGVDELDAGAGPLGRVRRPGGGRKRAADLDPGLLPALLALVEPDERGDPMTPLRWTTKSTRNLAAELAAQGHKVSADTVGDLLRAEGFSLQGNAKTLEGQRHPDRDAQFRYINEQVKAHQDTADPVISVDTKKKELVGQFANAGREWRPGGQPRPGEQPRLPPGQRGQGRALRDLRHRRQRRLGQRRHRPRHRRVRRGVGPPLVERGRPGRVPGRPGGCWSPRTRAAPTATAPGPGRPSWPPWPSRPGWRSPSATSRQGRRSGTRSSTGCSPTSR